MIATLSTVEKHHIAASAVPMAQKERKREMNDDGVVIAIVTLAIAIMVLFSHPYVDGETEEVAPVQEIEEIETEHPEGTARLERVERVEFAPPFAFWIDPEVPLEVQDAAHYYGDAYHISPQLLEAIAWQESRYDPSVEYKGCVGLMQINEKWHTDRMERLGVSHDDLYTVDGSMHVAADYLAELFTDCEDAAEVLMIYNGDSGVEGYRAGGEASEYATAILDRARELEERYDARGN